MHHENSMGRNRHEINSMYNKMRLIMLYIVQQLVSNIYNVKEKM